VVALSFLVLPHVVTTSTTLVDNQTAATGLQAIQAAQPYAPSTAGCSSKQAPADVIAGLKATGQPGPQTLATILTECNSSHDLSKALSAAGGLSNPQVQGLLAFQTLGTSIQNGAHVSQAEIQSKVGVHSQNLASLLTAEQKLLPAQKASPGEWKRWWTVCIIGMAIYALLIFTMRGRWSPRAARRDFNEHERLVTEELSKMVGEQAAPVA
jgi:hypothetical protein